LPSPKFSDQEAIEPSESELVEPLKVTLKGAFPLAGVGVLLSTAVGFTLEDAVTVTEAASVPPSPSSTVSVAVYVPCVVYVWLMSDGGVRAPESLPPSPKVIDHVTTPVLPDPSK